MLDGWIQFSDFAVKVCALQTLLSILMRVMVARSRSQSGWDVGIGWQALWALWWVCLWACLSVARFALTAFTG